MLGIFTLAINSDCLFLVIFQSFHCFATFIFDKLALPEYTVFFLNKPRLLFIFVVILSGFYSRAAFIQERLLLFFAVILSKELNKLFPHKNI